MDNEPPQDKTSYSGRFLDSLRSLGMTCRGVVLFCLRGGYSERFRNGIQAVPYGFAGRLYLFACCSYNAECGTAPHPPPMAVPLPRRGRFWCFFLRRTGKPEPQKDGTRASLGGSWLAWASLMRAAGQRETLRKQWANP